MERGGPPSPASAFIKNREQAARSTADAYPFIGQTKCERIVSDVGCERSGRSRYTLLALVSRSVPPVVSEYRGLRDHGQNAHLWLSRTKS